MANFVCTWYDKIVEIKLATQMDSPEAHKSMPAINNFPLSGILKNFFFFLLLFQKRLACLKNSSVLALMHYPANVNLLKL